MDATPRDELRVALRQRGLTTGGLKQELVERLLHGQGAQELTEDAATTMQFVGRRSSSKPEGPALSSDAGAYAWIVKVCGEQPQGHDSISGPRWRAPG